MRADGRGVEVLLGQGEAALQSGQAVLVIGELLPGHQVDTGQLEQGLQPLVVEQARLALVVVHPQPGLGVQADVGDGVILLQFLQLGPDGLGLAGQLGQVGLLEGIEHILPGGLHAIHPVMVGGQHRFGGGEPGRRRAVVHDELAQGIQLIERLHGLFVGQHLGSAVAEVFQLARRGVGLE